MKIGIIQGRLSKPKEGFQECPVNWKREFDLLPSLGLNHIEWIITSDNFDNNPIFHTDLKGYPISSVCADFMVNDNFLDADYLDKFLKITCKATLNHGINNITIPLLENSDVNDDKIMENFIDVFYPYTKKFKNINFLIEAELHQKKLKKVLGINTNLFVTYDTGNITSCKLNHKDYIFELNNKIKQVHIKDRIVNPLETVEPTMGDTDFGIIFKSLKEVKFDGLYTLQTARMEDGNEINTISKHKKIIEGLYYNE
jgi:sugar phosphate isomerase/epimerase